MGRIEQAHIQLPIHSQSGAHFPPQSGGGQSKGALFYQIVAPGYVTAGASHTAAGVFDQRPGDQICPHLGGLLLIDKFTVTVVYHHNAVGVLLFGNLCHLLCLLQRETGAQLIPATALDIHHGHRIVHRFGNGFIV